MGLNCPKYSCDAPPYLGIEQGRYLCPRPNLWLKSGESAFASQSIDAGQILGCKSNCSVYNTQQYCCKDQYNYPEVCPSSNPMFNQVCPQVYTYAYADYTGHPLGYCSFGQANATLSVTFCPQSN